MDGIIEQTRRFHRQPMDEKMKVVVGKDLHGFLPPGAQTQRSSRYNKNTKPELSASFYIRREYPEGHPDRVADKPWSFINKWPEEASLPGYRAALLEYFDRLDALFGHILPLFSIALGLPANWFSDSEAFPPPIWAIFTPMIGWFCPWFYC